MESEEPHEEAAALKSPIFSGAGEEAMRRKIASLLALGIAVAVPLSAKAAFAESGRYYWPKHHRSNVVRAEAPCAAIGARRVRRRSETVKRMG